VNPERHLVGLNEAQRAAAQHGVGKRMIYGRAER
jgi:hypothetical protein